MAGFYYFTHLIRTHIVDGPAHRAIYDPVTVELYKGPRTLRVNELAEPVLPPDSKVSRYRERRIDLEAGPLYLQLTARTKSSDALAGGPLVQNAIDRVLTALTAHARAELAATPLFRGWLIKDNRTVNEAWLKVSPVSAFDLAGTIAQCRSALTAVTADADTSSRYSLMSRLYIRQAGWPPSEEKFLWLWMMLEVHPMRNTTDIRPLVQFFADRLGRPEAETKSRLELGKLFGVRSDLVHNGTFPSDHKTVGQLLNKLEKCCVEAIRALLGYPYEGALDQYFR